MTYFGTYAATNNVMRIVRDLARTLAHWHPTRSSQMTSERCDTDQCWDLTVGSDSGTLSGRAAYSYLWSQGLVPAVAVWLDAQAWCIDAGLRSMRITASTVRVASISASAALRGTPPSHLCYWPKTAQSGGVFRWGAADTEQVHMPHTVWVSPTMADSLSAIEQAPSPRSSECGEQPSVDLRYVGPLTLVNTAVGRLAGRSVTGDAGKELTQALLHLRMVQAILQHREERDAIEMELLRAQRGD